MSVKKNNYAFNLQVILLFTGILLLPQISLAEMQVSMRPHAGNGISNSSDPQFDGNVRHIGMRILLHADGSRKFGIELNKFQFDENNKAPDFYSFGIVLERTLAHWFKMSVGTVGYIQYGVNSDSPVGIVTNLGWEPDYYGSIKPFIVLRNDFIFHDSTTRMNSLSLGVTLTF